MHMAKAHNSATQGQSPREFEVGARVRSAFVPREHGSQGTIERVQRAETGTAYYYVRWDNARMNEAPFRSPFPYGREQLRAVPARFTAWSNGVAPGAVGSARIVREGATFTAEHHTHGATAPAVERFVAGDFDAGRAWLRARGFEA